MKSLHQQIKFRRQIWWNDLSSGVFLVVWFRSPIISCASDKSSYPLVPVFWPSYGLVGFSEMPYIVVDCAELIARTRPPRTLQPILVCNCSFWYRLPLWKGNPSSLLLSFLWGWLLLSKHTDDRNAEQPFIVECTKYYHNTLTNNIFPYANAHTCQYQRSRLPQQQECPECEEELSCLTCLFATTFLATILLCVFVYLRPNFDCFSSFDVFLPPSCFFFLRRLCVLLILSHAPFPRSLPHAALMAVIAQSDRRWLDYIYFNLF